MSDALGTSRWMMKRHEEFLWKREGLEFPRRVLGR